MLFQLWAICVLLFLVTGYGDPVLVGAVIFLDCFVEQHHLLLLLLRVIEGGGIFLTSLLQTYPCIDHPYKDDI